MYKFILIYPLTGDILLVYNSAMPTAAHTPDTTRAYRKTGKLYARKGAGRPTKNAARLRKVAVKKRFAQAYGIWVLKSIEYMGYLSMKKKPHGVKVEKVINPKTNVEIVDPSPKSYSTDVLMVFKTIIRSLAAGKEVPGFTLLPAGRAAGNPTVDVVVIENFTEEYGFAPGHYLRGKALCLLKPAFIDDAFRPKHKDFKDFFDIGGKISIADLVDAE